jgi:hypothetical protein
MLSITQHWNESGTTQQAFCQQHHLTCMTYYYWPKQYRCVIDENSFLPVEISLGSYIEFHYPGVVILQLPAAKRLSTVKQLIKLLRLNPK